MAEGRLPHARLGRATPQPMFGAPGDLPLSGRRPGGGAARGWRAELAVVPRVWWLLLLALPVIASLQFYLGYPLRLATAHAAAPLLGLGGIDAAAAGAALLWHGQTVLVDPPCAGIGMLWVGSWSAALLSYLNGASARRTLLNGIFAAVVVFAANVLRNVLLFFPEAGLLQAPAWLHAAIGLAAFAAALLPIVAFTHWRTT